MTADTAKVEGNTAKEVRDNFPQDKEYTFVFNSEGYQGVLTKQSLDQLQDDDLLNDVLIHVEPVRQTNLLQKVIPFSLNTRFDLPVINKKGELKGRLESSKLADVLSP